jgi:hypothetical protein
MFKKLKFENVILSTLNLRRNLRPLYFLPPLYCILGIAFTWHSSRRKTKKEKGDVAFLLCYLSGGRGGGYSNDSTKAWSSLFILVPEIRNRDCSSEMHHGRPQDKEGIIQLKEGGGGNANDSKKHGLRKLFLIQEWENRACNSEIHHGRPQNKECIIVLLYSRKGEDLFLRQQESLVFFIYFCSREEEIGIAAAKGTTGDPRIQRVFYSQKEGGGGGQFRRQQKSWSS